VDNIKTDLKEIDFEDEKWMDPAENNVKYYSLIIAVFKLRVILSGSLLISEVQINIFKVL
jgi:hypothetical protein